MKQPFSSDTLPPSGVFVACSSHEDRCLGIVQRFGGWRPKTAVIFHYDDPNPRREHHHATIRSILQQHIEIIEVGYTEADGVASYHAQRKTFLDVISDARGESIILDISVFTKRHLLMLLRWLDDQGCWEQLRVLYTEPLEYEIEGHMPLSFGISSVEQVPGFSAAPNPSRPLHLAMFLGYEGDRAFATYELLQARKTTLIIPDPPFRPEWINRTEALNRDLLSVVGTSALRKADGLDPDSSYVALEQCLGAVGDFQEFSRAISPLGTKPQVFGAYMYIRRAVDAPAVIYTGSLRHNHTYYSRGVGPSWLIHSSR